MPHYRLRINNLFSDYHQTVRSTLQIKENPDSRIFSQVPKIHFLEVGLHYISFQHQHCSVPKSPCRTSKVKEANKLQQILHQLFDTNSQASPVPERPFCRKYHTVPTVPTVWCRLLMLKCNRHPSLNFRFQVSSFSISLTS